MPAKHYRTEIFLVCLVERIRPVCLRAGIRTTFNRIYRLKNNFGILFPVRYKEKDNGRFKLSFNFIITKERHTMGDKGGKKDKEKGQKQKSVKTNEKAQIKQDKQPKKKQG